ncbi:MULTISPECIES: glycosyltransferase [unclassified Clostridioides]|uniref:glycosyltransferase n=1 Tax=unclassified Clostridioides TaxID=2635829 RepID=UPI001D11B320|nr:glycosyltransferase [Clostridioides sp. ES-S-0171-01]MCC0688032.1 glycosyltransferase [Clostridioides sp. ES-S-0056-01]MCC0715247.1 glycosyltransferase [Clostridioides sp. ES-S-0077-01]UDN54947.1 glycosyltransferase [Clostridioides sp. ES-S-0054-01]
MLLSIVMMVKNEEKMLNKTLEALKQLRDSIDSELIIMDTGSTDNTVKIAKEHTEKVYFHKWDNDFSSMRNKAISYSKGQWVFILDADEVLTDCTKMIEFFNSDLCKKFKSASIQLKNIYSLEKSSYGYSSVLRLFRNDNFKFVGRVHEQPLYKDPVFHNIAEFDHYGYIFEDEEFRIQKVKRNEELLLQQLEEDKDNPYVNYQLGKNFIILEKYHDALFYLERSNNLYKSYDFVPGYVLTSLAKIYLYLGKHKKCEKLCLKYINKDMNNIDIYYYLAQAEVSLGKYENSIDSYKRFIYLVDNYEVSTQANSLFSDTDAVSFKDIATITLIKIYYKLEKYDLVIKEFKNIEDKKKMKDVYFSLFMSLYKLDIFENILDYYNDLPISPVEKKYFYESIEIFIQNIRECEKNSIYKILCSMDGNYGRFNKIRLDRNLSLDECKNILESENTFIYAPLIIIAHENDINLLDIFYNMDYVWIERYMQYSVNYDKRFILKLYKYVLKQPNTFDINKIKVYRVFVKVVLENNILDEKKYKELFYIYMMYSYQYIKNIYTNFNNYEIIKYINGDVERFVLKLKILQDIKNDNKISYIGDLKQLLYEYPYCNKIIELLIKDFEKELNTTKEFNVLKKDFLINIENIINCGDIKNAKSMIGEYLELFDEESEILNMNGIINMMEGNYEEADFMFKKAYSLSLDNEDIIFNIKYLRELNLNYK